MGSLSLDILIVALVSFIIISFIIYHVTYFFPFIVMGSLGLDILIVAVVSFIIYWIYQKRKWNSR